MYISDQRYWDLLDRWEYVREQKQGRTWFKIKITKLQHIQIMEKQIYQWCNENKSILFYFLKQRNCKRFICKKINNNFNWQRTYSYISRMFISIQITCIYDTHHHAQNTSTHTHNLQYKHFLINTTSINMVMAVFMWISLCCAHPLTNMQLCDSDVFYAYNANYDMTKVLKGKTLICLIK